MLRTDRRLLRPIVHLFSQDLHTSGLGPLAHSDLRCILKLLKFGTHYESD